MLWAIKRDRARGCSESKCMQRNLPEEWLMTYTSPAVWCREQSVTLTRSDQASTRAPCRCNSVAGHLVALMCYWVYACSILDWQDSAAWCLIMSSVGSLLPIAYNNSVAATTPQNCLCTQRACKQRAGSLVSFCSHSTNRLRLTQPKTLRTYHHI